MSALILEYWQKAVLIVIFVIVAHGCFVTKWLVDKVKDGINSKAEKDPDFDYLSWIQLTEGVGVPGKWLGLLERIAFFVALVHGKGFELFIGAWLVFKVAAKWQAWTTIVKVPSNDAEVSLRMRRLLGGLVMQSFLIGTLSNILVAGIGYLIKIAVLKGN